MAIVEVATPSSSCESTLYLDVSLFAYICAH
jgi:hypothetical protein